MSIASISQVERPALLRSQRPAGFGRTLHLVDVENLAGTAALCTELVSDIQRRYVCAAGVGKADQVVIASSHYAARGAWFGWGGNPRRLLGSGPDGADRCLLGVLDCEDIASRFDHVVIASGDGLFSLAAAQLQAAGVSVTVVSRPEALSRRLRLAVRDVRFLDPPPAMPAAVGLREAA